MKYKMSPHVVVRTEQVTEAVEFYANVLGFLNRSDDPKLGNHDANPFNLYVFGDDEVN